MAQRFDPIQIRRKIIEMAYAGATVHVGCALSIVEILAVLYRDYLQLDPTDPDNAERDYLVLSKGHGVMTQYACLHELGWLSDADLKAYFSDGTRMKGLSDAHLPGLEVSSGSLGHGLSVGVGLALAAKRRGTAQRVFAIVGDGEANEGAIWEALMFASHAGLDNLIVILDANGLQAMGTTTEVMNMGSLAAKLSAFGLETRDVDGHDESALATTLEELLESDDPRPKGIVARTIKGRGISFMENNNAWHYTRLTEESYSAALAELRSAESAAA
jgi:transketolase